MTVPENGTCATQERTSHHSNTDISLPPPGEGQHRTCLPSSLCLWSLCSSYPTASQYCLTHFDSVCCACPSLCVPMPQCSGACLIFCLVVHPSHLGFCERRLAFGDQPSQSPLLLSSVNQSWPRMVHPSAFSPRYLGDLVVGYLSWGILTQTVHMFG